MLTGVLVPFIPDLPISLFLSSFALVFLCFSSFALVFLRLSSFPRDLGSVSLGLLFLDSLSHLTTGLEWLGIFSFSFESSIFH